MWEELTVNKSHENSIIAFQENMELLKESNSGFRCVVFRDSLRKRTGCTWEITLRDNFDRFGGFVAVDAMKRRINELDWTYVDLATCNELQIVCVGCEEIIVTKRQ